MEYDDDDDGDEMEMGEWAISFCLLLVVSSIRFAYTLTASYLISGKKRQRHFLSSCSGYET